MVRRKCETVLDSRKSESLMEIYQETQTKKKVLETENEYTDGNLEQNSQFVFDNDFEDDEAVVIKSNL